MFIAQLTFLQEKDITPIYVFDGPVPDIKKNTIDKRSANRIVMQGGGSYYILLLQNIFKQRSVEFVVAKNDAEKECAELCKQGKADVVVSADGDCLAFGAPLMLRNLSTNKKKTGMQTLDLDTILKYFDWDAPKFVDFCILSGCDFTAKVKGVGPKKARDIIDKYGSISTWVEKTKPQLPENFNFSHAQDYFLGK